MLVGVSGSGKSSLLADTLATEINSRMRRFLHVQQSHLDDRDVAAFLGPLPPGIHFAQAAFRASRRTTVGTSTGLLALLRRYFSRYSEPWAEEAASVVPLPSAHSYAAWIERHYTGSLIVWIVAERWRRTDGTNAVARLRKHGLNVAIISSETDSPARRGRDIDLAKFRPLAENTRHLIEAEIGRTQISGRCASLMVMLERAFAVGGDVIVEFESGAHLPRQLRTERGLQLDSAAHRVHPEVLEPFFCPSEALLSFNSPSNPDSGACGACQGLGTARSVRVGTLAAHPERSMHEGAFTLWTEKNYRYVNIRHETIEGLRGLRGFFSGHTVGAPQFGCAKSRSLRFGQRSRGRHRSANRAEGELATAFPGLRAGDSASGRRQGFRLATSDSGNGWPVPGMLRHTLVEGSPGPTPGALGNA